MKKIIVGLVLVLVLFMGCSGKEEITDIRFDKGDYTYIIKEDTMLFIYTFTSDGFIATNIWTMNPGTRLLITPVIHETPYSIIKKKGDLYLKYKLDEKTEDYTYTKIDSYDDTEINLWLIKGEAKKPAIFNFIKQSTSDEVR